MKEWKKYKVLELCTDIIDCVNKTAPISSIPTDFHMLRTSDIRNGFVNLEKLNCVTEETFLKWSRRGFLKEGDVIFTREAPLGEVGLVRYAKNYFLGQRLVLYRTNPEICDNRFLLYWFLNPQNKESIKSRGVGSTVTHLRVPECEKIEIYAPDLATQKRIGDILSAYDDLIENNQKQIKLLEEASQRLYKEWFVDLHFPDYESTPIVDGVPKGWKRITIKDLSVLLRRGISPKYNDMAKYNVINQKCIRQTVMDIKESRKQEKSYLDEMNLQDSDIVICSTGAGTLGRVGQVFGEYPDTTFDSHVTLVRAKEEVGKQFLFQSLKYQQPLFMILGQGSTNQLELSKRTIENYDIIYPTDKIVNTFEFILQPIHEKITSLVKVVKSATEARDRLLPKLMSGELEV